MGHNTALKKSLLLPRLLDGKRRDNKPFKTQWCIIKDIQALPTQCIYVFSMHLRTNSYYFHLCSSNWLAFTIDTESSLRGTDVYLNLLILFNLCLLLAKQRRTCPG